MIYRKKANILIISYRFAYFSLNPNYPSVLKTLQQNLQIYSQDFTPRVLSDRRCWCILSYFVMWGPAMVLMLLLAKLLSHHTLAPLLLDFFVFRFHYIHVSSYFNFIIFRFQQIQISSDSEFIKFSFHRIQNSSNSDFF